MRVAKRAGVFFLRLVYLVRAAVWASLLGIIELLRSERGRVVLGGGVLVATVAGMVAAVMAAHPLHPIRPGELGIRFNRITGEQAEVAEGFVVMVPGLHDLRVFNLRDQVYQPTRSSHARGEAPYQTLEGLSVGMDVTLRYALDGTRVAALARRLPDDLGPGLVEPVADGVLHRVIARHTVREVFSTKRAQVQEIVEGELRLALEKEGIIIRSVHLGNVDLPVEYRQGLETLLTEELSNERMRFTLELKEQMVKQAALEGDAEKVRREKAAESTASEEIIAARSRAEAMKHVLPLKEREIEQRRLEAEANQVTRLKLAEGEAKARRIESAGEADARHLLADSEAYRIDVTSKAQSAQLERDGRIIQANPLLIQKAMADKLSDKISVIIAPPQAGGLITGALLGMNRQHAPQAPTAATTTAEAAPE